MTEETNNENQSADDDKEYLLAVANRAFNLGLKLSVQTLTVNNDGKLKGFTLHTTNDEVDPVYYSKNLVHISIFLDGYEAGAS